MSDQPEAKRGEAAWKESLARVADRNAKAKKAGKERRQAYERERDDVRRASELRQRTQLLKQGPTK